VSEKPPPLPPIGIRDPGDAWVYGPNGEKFWGRFGASGLLVWHRALGVLLQHRVGLPGGARKQGESAVDGAMREAAEEATVPRDVLRVIETSVLDLGYWSYTTVVAEALEEFEPVIADLESAELRWVAVDEVSEMPLHPGFAAAWPDLREVLR
jgi:8-oxo-dGTP pyrophosphatase MutT (NUDIX family)